MSIRSIVCCVMLQMLTKLVYLWCTMSYSFIAVLLKSCCVFWHHLHPVYLPAQPVAGSSLIAMGHCQTLQQQMFQLDGMKTGSKTSTGLSSGGPGFITPVLSPEATGSILSARTDPSEFKGLAAQRAEASSFR